MKSNMEVFISLHENTEYEYILEDEKSLSFAKRLFTSRKEYIFSELTNLPAVFRIVQDPYILLNHLTNAELSTIFSTKGRNSDMIHAILNPQQQRLSDGYISNLVSKVQSVKGKLYRLDRNYEINLKRTLIKTYYVRDTKDLTRIFLFPKPIPLLNNHAPLSDEYADALMLLYHSKRILDPNDERFIEIGDAKLPYVNHVMQMIEGNYSQCKPHDIPYLNRYTVGDIYTKLLLLCIPVVDEVTKYKIYNILLAQFKFRIDSRGSWYIEGAKLMDLYGIQQGMSEKQRNEKILAICEKGIRDEYCHNIEKIILTRKAKKLQNKLNTVKSTRQRFHMNLKPAPVLEIPAKITRNAKSSRPLYSSGDFSIAPVLVEPFVLEYFKKSGYVGIHCESRLFSCIFSFFMYHILFKPVPHVFVYDNQEYPLDLFSPHFFKNRSTDIMEWLTIINTFDEDRISRYVKRNNPRFEKLVIGLNLPKDESYSMNIADFSKVCCLLGGKVISSICRYVSYNYRRNLSGGPDLLIWNDTECKMIEVKGIGDKLQVNQQIWADLLVECGAPIYLCQIREEN
eukprot:NODE_466_length_8129_cov_0.354545.p1 type:complete len:567 gc:universal NODE_466_length_8129_cov_0.354545:1227-2927(+)